MLRLFSTFPGKSCAEAEPGGVQLVADDDPEDGHFWEVGELHVSYDEGDLPVCEFNVLGRAGCRQICQMKTSDEGCSVAEVFSTIDCDPRAD